jgi:hypothetical protein
MVERGGDGERETEIDEGGERMDSNFSFVSFFAQSSVSVREQ